MWPNFPLSITNKPREWCQGARGGREGQRWRVWGGRGGLPGLRAKAEHKHNSNRNQVEPSKLFMRQMDTFPRDFTLKHGSAPPPPPLHPPPHRRRLAPLHTHTALVGTVITITLSKPFHVWFVSTLKSGSPSTLWSHVCSSSTGTIEGGTCSLSSIFKDVGTALTLSEGYYTNQRVLGDACHVHHRLHLAPSDVRSQAAPKKLRLCEKSTVLRFFFFLFFCSTAQNFQKWHHPLRAH